jgi:hypothetical protein
MSERNLTEIQVAERTRIRRRSYPANHSEVPETRHFAAHVGMTSGDFFSRSRAIVLDLI